MCRDIFNTFHAIPVARKLTFVILNLDGPAKQKLYHLGNIAISYFSRGGARGVQGVQGVHLNPPLRQTYFLFMENF